MLLNRIPFLDDGWIARVSSSNESNVIRDVQGLIGHNAIFNKRIPDLASLTIAIRCPIFVQLNLSTYGLDIIPVSISNEIKAYIPNEAEISTKLSIADASELKNYFKETTEAMLMNTKTLVMDGCDKFVAQILAPVSTYNELIIHGSLRQWIPYIRQGQLYKPLNDAKITIEGIIKAEWPEISTL